MIPLTQAANQGRFASGASNSSSGLSHRNCGYFHARFPGVPPMAGWPDIEIAGRERYGVLSIPALFFLEVKTETGKLNLKQKKLHPRLRQLGFKVAVVRSIDDVRDALIAWRIPRLEAGYAPSNHGDAA